ncbi:hypothetical protein RINTHM_2640 [Richelia intracellularis HM01]|uniref:hypothetical protein n=1 Tax=Richelia intracellularis TaxID=1164990 RepID=UPI0002B5B37A|nr:hypothetical protein [Richelia intracellularis]CCH64740.1 hypothetical protein RINTHM_2640 [Richelia intracellularis HM01]
MIIICKSTSVPVQGCGYSERTLIGLGNLLLIPLKNNLRQLKLPEKKQILERGEKLRRKNHL